MEEEIIPLNSILIQNSECSGTDTTTLSQTNLTSSPTSLILKGIEKFKKLVQLIRIGNVLVLEEILVKYNNERLINFHGEHGKTLLHIATENRQPDCVRILLQAGADPNKLDGMGRTPLHGAVAVLCHCEKCSNKIIKCIEKLLEHGAEVSIKDINEDTPLRLAAINMLPKCALILLDHDGFIEAGHHKTGHLIIEKMPEVFLRILDDGIAYDEHDNSKLRLNFGWLFHKKSVRKPCFYSSSVNEKISRNSKFDEMAVLLKLTKITRRKERKAILTHPWLEAFLHLKWLAVRKWFWLIRTIYMIFLVFYSYFIFEIFVWRCPYSNYYSISEELNITTNNYSSDAVDIEKNCHTNLPDILLYVFATVGILCIICMILNEIFEFKIDKKAYLTNYLNLLWWYLIVSLILTILPAFGMVPRRWHYPIAAFGLFYAWGMNFTQISRLPHIGDYIEMLGKVLGDFFLFVMTFSSLVIAFTLSMCVMFPENEYFKNVPLGFVKVLLIMIGEADYDGLFKDNDQIENLEYSIPAHILYVGFIFVVTIVLMNLLLALAVNDIQALRKQSSIKRAIRQITQISILETFINNVGIGTWLASHVLRRSSVEATVGQYFTFSPINPLDNRFPKELKEKFIPYLATSPCLIRHKRPTFKSILAPIRWRNFKNLGVFKKNEDSSTAEKFNNDIGDEHAYVQQMEEMKLMLKTVGYQLNDMKSQFEKLSIKIDRKL